MSLSKSTDQKQLIKKLLTAGMVAGPFYLLVAILQVLFRPGFDITRHDLSLMSNGPLGWIQITNFIVTGLWLLAGAYGLRKALTRTPGGKWGPMMLALYGLGLITAGIFVADPMNGFPPGSQHMNEITTSGILHLISGSVGFVGLIAACFIFARRFARQKEKNWRNFSLVTGTLFFFAFIGIASGSQPGSKLLTTVTLDFWSAVILSFTWLSMLFAKIKRTV
jgi:hypothetical membrane protein